MNDVVLTHSPSRGQVQSHGESPQNARAKLDVSTDELNADYQKTKYKWRIPADTTAYPRPYKVTWIEVFTPEDSNPNDDQVPEKKFIVMSEEVTGAESMVHEIDPKSKPDEEGTWEVSLLPVEVAVDADRDGEITFDGKDKTTAKSHTVFGSMTTETSGMKSIKHLLLLDIIAIGRKMM